jgi:hypothetical protein
MGMQEVKISKILALFTKFYLNNRNTISLNKNLVLSGIVGFVISLFVAYYSNIYSADKFLNSALTVLTGFISSKVIFVILFHLDHKKKYTKRFSGKLNLGILKQVVMKMIFADSIFDIINNVSRFFILLELLKINYHPIQAALIASIIASALSYLAINLIVRRIHVFGRKRKIL